MRTWPLSVAFAIFACPWRVTSAAHLEKSRSRLRLPSHLHPAGAIVEGTRRGETVLVKEQPVGNEASRDDLVEDFDKESHETVRTLRNADVQRTVEHEMQSINEVFFPGFRLGHVSQVVIFSSIPLGIVWLTLFFTFLYKHDHGEMRMDGTQQEGDENDASPMAGSTPRDHRKLTPDIVIVFHHPNHDYADKEDEISRETLERLGVKDSMRNLTAATKNAGQKSMGTLAHGLMRCVDNHTSERGTTMGEARLALLQDLRAAMLKRDFEHTLFSSRDDDEVFLCVSLETDNDEAIGYYVAKNAIPLQMRPEVVRKMGIDQPVEASDPTYTSSSPPFIPYDRSYVKALGAEPSMLGQRLRIKIRWSKGLKNEEVLSGAIDPYCVCKIPGKAQSVFRTKVINSTSDPIWDEEGEIEWYKAGDSITFTVFDRDSALLKNDELLGEVTLSSADFEPDGFDGTLSLTHTGHHQEDSATLSVCVEVVGKPSTILNSDDARSLYRTHYGKDPRGTIISSKDRIKVIYRELNQLLDLDAAKYHGLITNWYVSHSPSWIDKISARWANWIQRPDVFFRQPVSLLKDYFGARVAFIVAWSSHYFKSLWALLPLAFVEFTVMVAYNDRPDVKARLVFSYTIIVIFWQQVVINLWDQEQEYLSKLWGMDMERESQTVRPSFQGETQPSLANKNAEDIVYPESKTFARRMLTAFATIFFCVVVFTIMIMWINMWKGAMGILATVFLTVMIFTFECCYNAIMPEVIAWENHKYQSTYVDSYIWKQFIFQFVNNFGPFVYLAGKQRYSEAGCPTEGCLSLLRFELLVALSCLTTLRVIQVVFTCFLVKWEIDSEERAMSTKAEIGFVERQAKFEGYRFKEQIEDMLELVIALGYVLLFGAVAPIVVAFCLVAFLVQISTNAHLLVRFKQRSLPRTQNGVGAWRDVVKTLSIAGVLVNAFLFVTESYSVGPAPIITKLSAFIVYCIGAMVFAAVITVFYPNTGTEVRLLHMRRATVLSKLQEIVSAAHTQEDQRHIEEKANRTTTPYALKMPDWGQLPHVTAEDRLTGKLMSFTTKGSLTGSQVPERRSSAPM